MSERRLTRAAWLVMQRLSQATAMLRFCGDPACGRYHLALRANMIDVVRDSTIKSLNDSGVLSQTRIYNRSYVLNDKGRKMLLERMSPAAFAEEVQ